MTKRELHLLNLKMGFNDIAMRELGLDITDDDYIYDMDTETIIQINEKFIKYSDLVDPILKFNEIDLNLIENPKLMENLVLKYLTDHINNKIVSLSQSLIAGSNKGYFEMAYLKNNEVMKMKSDPYKNESVRILNLICKINKTVHLYDFNKYDIVIDKKGSKW